jgi:hypothetical protein
LNNLLFISLPHQETFVNSNNLRLSIYHNNLRAMIFILPTISGATAANIAGQGKVLVNMQEQKTVTRQLRVSPNSPGQVHGTVSKRKLPSDCSIPSGLTLNLLKKLQKLDRSDAPSDEMQME